MSADAPLETLTLVPFGSQMLRVSVFPVVGAPKSAAVAWKEEFAVGWQERLLVFGGGAAHDGALRLERAAKAVAPRTDFHDVAFEAEVTVGAKGDAGLLFRVTEPSVGVDHYRGYYVGLDAERGRVLFGKSDNAWTQLESRPLVVRAREPHRLRVEARGTRVRVWVDDAKAPALEAEDGSFSHGSVGVRSYSDAASFGRLSAFPTAE